MLLDGHNALQGLFELPEVQIKIPLVSCELVHIISKNGYVALLIVFNDGHCGAVDRQDLRQLWLVLLLHELTNVTLGAQEDLHFFGRGKVGERAALLQEEVEEVLALVDSRVILGMQAKLCLARNGWDIQTREPVNEHHAEVVEVLEAALAIDIAEAVTARHLIRVMLSHATLDKYGFTTIEIDLAIIGRHIDGFVGVSAARGRNGLLLLLLSWISSLCCLGRLVLIAVPLLLLLLLRLHVLVLRVLLLLLRLATIGVLRVIIVLLLLLLRLLGVVPIYNGQSRQINFLDKISLFGHPGKASVDGTNR